MNMIIMPVMMTKERDRKELSIDGVLYREIFSDETLRRVKRQGIVYEEVERDEAWWETALFIAGAFAVILFVVVPMVFLLMVKVLFPILEWISS